MCDVCSFLRQNFVVVCSAGIRFCAVCCSGMFGSGVCIFSKYLIYDTFHHRFTLNGFAHKVFQGDWFCGKSVGLAKIQVGELRVNVYGTHVRMMQIFWIVALIFFCIIKKCGII